MEFLVILQIARLSSRGDFRVQNQGYLVRLGVNRDAGAKFGKEVTTRAVDSGDNTVDSGDNIPRRQLFMEIWGVNLS